MARHLPHAQEKGPLFSLGSAGWQKASLEPPAFFEIQRDIWLRMRQQRKGSQERGQHERR